MRYLEEIALKQIIEEYQNGTPLKEISKKLHLPIQMVKSELLEYGGEKGKAILLKELEKKYPMIKEMIKKCRQEKTIEQLSEQYHLTQNNIRDAIRQYQTITGETILARNKQGLRNFRDDLQIDEIIDGYKKGNTFKELANEQECSVTAIINRVNDYIQEHGNQIVEERNKAIEERYKIKKYRIKIPIEEIAEKCNQGKTYDEIAKDYGVTATTIHRRIKDYEKQTRKKITSINQIGQYKIKLPIEEIVEKCNQGKTYAEIAKVYGISEEVIRLSVKKYQINKYRIKIPIEEIVNKRKQGESYAEIAKDYGVSATTIHRRIKDYEKQTRKKILIEETVEQREQVKTYPEIAKDYVITDTTIRKRMKEDEIEKNTKVENHKIQIMDLSMIVNYFKLGYSIDKIQEFAKENDYKINESDIEIAQKIQKGELKVATEASIEKIVEKYGYSYGELTQIAEKKGYVVLEDRYVSAKANINNKNKKGEER